MVVVGADVHKRTHTFVAVDEVGKKLAEKVVRATSWEHHTRQATFKAARFALWPVSTIRAVQT